MARLFVRRGMLYADTHFVSTVMQAQPACDMGWTFGRNHWVWSSLLTAMPVIQGFQHPL